MSNLAWTLQTSGKQRSINTPCPYLLPHSNPSGWIGAPRGLACLHCFFWQDCRQLTTLQTLFSMFVVATGSGLAERLVLMVVLNVVLRIVHVRKLLNGNNDLLFCCALIEKVFWDKGWPPVLAGIKSYTVLTCPTGLSCPWKTPRCRACGRVCGTDYPSETPACPKCCS